MTILKCVIILTGLGYLGAATALFTLQRAILFPIPTTMRITPQAAGLVTMPNTPNLTANIPAQITCPAGHSQGQAGKVVNGSCRQISYPLLLNNIIWQNRTFNITVGATATSINRTWSRWCRS